MKKVYTDHERRNIDTAIPIEEWKQVDDTYFFVMNYNQNGPFGKMEDMRIVARERNIDIS